MPTYPAGARAAGLEGWVRVRYAVGADGAVLNPQVLEASPEGVFDASARAAVARWRYAPDPRGLGWEAVESVVRFELGERVLP